MAKVTIDPIEARRAAMEAMILRGKMEVPFTNMLRKFGESFVKILEVKILEHNYYFVLEQNNHHKTYDKIIARDYVDEYLAKNGLHTGVVVLDSTYNTEGN